MLDSNFLSLFLHASFLVQLVMLSLFLASFLSWMLIFRHGAEINSAYSQVVIFERDFSDNIDFTQLYNNYSKRGQKNLSACKSIFVAGYLEFMRLQRYSGHDTSLILNATKRAMGIELRKNIAKLEKNLSILASIQSMSPYIGLFGTVWGIIHAFKELGSAQQASLSMVAPGISEALIATAMGLVAAIPAGIFYNRYITKIASIDSKLENYVENLLGLFQRRMYIAEEHMVGKDL